MVWTLIEPGVAIVAASLVTIRPLLRQMRLRGFESSQRSRSRNIFNRYNRSRGTAEVLDDEEELDGMNALYDGKHQKAGGKMTTTTTTTATTITSNGAIMSNVMLEDLKTAHLDSSRPVAWPESQGFAGREQANKIVMVARSSTLDDQAHVVTQTGVHGGIGIAITIQEDLEELARQENNINNNNNNNNNIEKDDQSHEKQKKNLGNLRTRKEAPPRVLEGSGGIIATTRTTILTSPTMATAADARMWRSETPSSPSSPEESNVIQGLSYPDRRDARSQSPFP